MLEQKNAYKCTWHFKSQIMTICWEEGVEGPDEMVFNSCLWQIFDHILR